MGRFFYLCIEMRVKLLLVMPAKATKSLSGAFCSAIRRLVWAGYGQMMPNHVPTHAVSTNSGTPMYVG